MSRKQTNPSDVWNVPAEQDAEENDGIMKRTPLKRTEFKRKPYRWRRRKPKHNWKEMAAAAWLNAGGHCERCSRILTTGTAPAHLKPRSAGGSDDPSNLALLCIGGAQCHTYLDENRAKVATEEAWLQERMKQSDEVREYFERLISRREYILETEKNRKRGAIC